MPSSNRDDTTAGQPVWDLPVRLFHWLLAALILFSWWSGKNEEIELHIWSGCAILTLLLFRLLWGLFGSSTARFSSFVRGPRTVLAYVRDRRSWQVAGHEPLGALSILAMLVAIAIQVGLGLFAQDSDGLYLGPLARIIGSDASDRIREVHERWVYVVLALIALHVAAVAYYRLVRGRKLTKAMITGRAALEPGIQPMRPGKFWVAAVCLAVALAVTRWVIAGAPPFGP